MYYETAYIDSLCKLPVWCVWYLYVGPRKHETIFNNASYNAFCAV